MTPKKDSRQARRIRHQRVRRKVVGRTERPRLCISRSLNHIYAQVIDDERGHTLTAASTLDGQLRGMINGKTKTEAAREVGRMVAERARANGVSRVVFDRGGCRYHGRVRALAEAAREAGLEF